MLPYGSTNREFLSEYFLDPSALFILSNAMSLRSRTQMALHLLTFPGQGTCPKVGLGDHGYNPVPNIDHQPPTRRW